MAHFYYLKNDNLPFGIESVGNHWHQPPINRPEGYPYYHWIHTESGAGTFTVRDTSFTLAPGQGVLLRPFVPHRYQSAALAPWQTAFITFKGYWSDKIAELVGPADFIKIDQPVAPFQATIDRMVGDYATKQIDPYQHSALSYDFLLTVSRFSHSDAPTHDNTYTQFVAPAIAFIEANLDLNLTVQAIADASFISPQYLSRLFKHYTGKTPYQYIIDGRINKAKTLLLSNKNYSVKYVAACTGFRSASHFITSFKQNCGVTPSGYRQSHQ